MSTHSERDKGCFDILATDIKSDIVKHLQQQGKNLLHGHYLSLNLPLKDGKRIQRVKGIFYQEMIKRSSKIVQALMKVTKMKVIHWI